MEQLKQQLLYLVNNSQLPLEAIYYVVKDFYRDVDDAYQQALQQEIAKAKAAQQAALDGDTESKEEEQKEENE